MKIPCEMVQDLLPLYHDDACSDTSKNIIEDHLNECPVCKKMLTDLDRDISGFRDEMEEESSPEMSALQQVWIKNTKTSYKKGVYRGTLGILLIAFCLALLYFVPLPHYYNKTYTIVYTASGEPSDAAIQVTCWHLNYLFGRTQYKGSVTLLDASNTPLQTWTFDDTSKRRTDEAARAWQKRNGYAFPYSKLAPCEIFIYPESSANEESSLYGRLIWSEDLENVLLDTVDTSVIADERAYVGASEDLSFQELSQHFQINLVQ